MQKRPRKSRRPRFLQYGVRTLLGLMLLVAALAAWYRSAVHPRLRQDEVTAKLAEAGASLEWRSAGPGWLQTALAPVTGDDGLRDCVVVHAEHTGVGDDDVENLHRLRWLERLYLADTQIGDDGLKRINGLPRLRRLSLWSTPISDEGLAHLTNLPSLEVLDINGEGSSACLEYLSELRNLRRLHFTFPLDDEGLFHLAKLPHLQLQRLVLRDVTNAGLAELPNWPDLTELNITGRDFTDDGLRHLAVLPLLTRLTMNETAINGSGLRFLDRLPNLTHLSLKDAPIDDAHRQYIDSLSHLEFLDLQDTPITDVSTQCFCRLQKLRCLNLRGTNVTADCLENLDGMTALQYLHFDQPLDDEAVRHLAGIPNLVEFTNASDYSAANCFVTDAGLEALAEIDFIRYLNLYDASAGTHIDGIDVPTDAQTMTDAGLAHVWRMPNLRRVGITGQNVSLAAINGMSAGTNDCYVEFYFPSTPEKAFARFLDDHVHRVKMQRRLLELQCSDQFGGRHIAAHFRQGSCDLGLLRYMPGLKELFVLDSRVGISWRDLRYAPGLTALHLPTESQPTRVDSDGLAVLGTLTKLRGLTCCLADDLPPEHLMFLANLDKLEYLALAGRDYTADQLHFLASLDNLQTLILDVPPRSTDDEHGLKHLIGRRQLSALTLRECSDVSMQYVGQLKKLFALQIAGTVTDEGLKQLYELPELYDFNILDTKISVAAFTEFEKKRPKVRIRH